MEEEEGVFLRRPLGEDGRKKNDSDDGSVPYTLTIRSVSIYPYERATEHQTSEHTGG